MTSELPVVLSIEVVEDFNFGVGIDVGGELRREDFGE
jgi:hypothetical protein